MVILVSLAVRLVEKGLSSVEQRLNLFRHHSSTEIRRSGWCLRRDLLSISSSFSSAFVPFVQLDGRSQFIDWTVRRVILLVFSKEHVEKAYRLLRSIHIGVNLYDFL